MIPGRITFFILATVILTSCSNGKDKSASLTCQQEFDFERIHKMDTIRHCFWIKNTGELPLVIKAVNPSCGCTDVDYSKIEIPSGDSGYLKFRLIPSDTGYLKKSIVIETNADPIYYVFHIKGRVVQ